MVLAADQTRPYLLDGSHEVYNSGPRPRVGTIEAGAPPSPVIPPPYVGRTSLFGDDPKSSPSPQRPPASPALQEAPVIRPVVPLKDIEDWLEFAESVLGRQGVPETPWSLTSSTSVKCPSTKTSSTSTWTWTRSTA